MAKLSNLDAETGANIIDDDAQPTLTITNTSTGPGLSVDDVVITSAATINAVNLIGAGKSVNTATEGIPFTINRSTTVASPTVALLTLGIGSGASAPVFELSEQAFVSCTTIQFTTVAVAGTGAIRVKYGNNYGWIPVMNATAVTAAPRG